MESGGGYMCARRSTLRLNPLAQFLPSSPGPLPPIHSPGVPGSPSRFIRSTAIGYALTERTAGQNKTKILKSEFDGRGKAVIVRHHETQTISDHCL